MNSAPARAYISLGANLGDSRATLRQALTELARAPGILACRASPFYRSAPVDAQGPDFINAVAQIDTSLTPLALLDLLQALELRHGRARPYRNAPRTLDLDLLCYADLHMQTARLTLPHPRLHERAFVLAPLRDLAPTLMLTQGGLDALLEGIQDQAIERLPD